MTYEYAVISAPDRGERQKGLKTPAERLAQVLASEINRMAADGWDYVRAETLPSEERAGLTGRQTVYVNLLVFRRLQAGAVADRPVQSASEQQPPAPPAQEIAQPADAGAAPDMAGPAPTSA